MKQLGWMAAAGLSILALGGCQKKTETKGEVKAPPATQGVGPLAGPVAPPRRRAGLWELTMKEGGVAQTQRLCIDETTDARLGLTGQQHGPKPCRQEATTKTATGYEVHSVCDVGEMGTVTSRATLTGDPRSNYRVDIASTTTGARAPEVNGSHNFTMTAAWKGPCPSGWKPGDMEVAGQRFNPVEVQKRASGGE